MSNSELDEPSAGDLSLAMQSDRPGLRRLWQSIEQAKAKGEAFDRRLNRYQQQLAQSQAQLRRRQQRLPKIEYDAALPISARRDEIAEAIRDNPVVIVCGETGSGKSTQLPKICLEQGRGISATIAHTQPRRIAARSVAARVAEELGSPLGEAVGFKVRFTDVTKTDTYIKLMTDGILLAESQQDRQLDAYDTIILDEAHERSLNIDFLLGYLKRLLPRRPDLRVIITSATIDAQRFQDYFAQPSPSGRLEPAPLIEVSGRTYPVEVRYRPPKTDDDGEEPEMSRCVADAVNELAKQGPGDMLVFLPTERDIREVARVLRGRSRSVGEILPLYARLSAAEQNRVFQSHAGRRVVLATNVAESSLTVPGIRYVIDTGTARMSRYSARMKVQRLPVESVSKASAEQRKGRCGRIGPGICIRLYDQEDFESRDEFTTPEIRRSNLASVILQTMSLELGAIEDFPFPEPPRPEAIRDGYKTLFELGAIDQEHRVTAVGRKLSRLPVDPRIGRMILAGDDEGCLHEVLIIASGLEVQDPRERPTERRQAADDAHSRHRHEESDFLSLLNLWDFYHEMKEKLSRNRLAKACHQNFLSSNRLREWQDVHRQLMQLAEDHGLRPGPRRDDYGAIHRALLSGLLANIAQRTDKNEYSASGGSTFYLWPGSGLFQSRPGWIVCAEMVETTRRYLRTAARINPKWIEPLAEHLVKRAYTDPAWSRPNGCVMANEKVTLFGLPIVAARKVRFGSIDPEQARQIFIDDALVPGEIDTSAAFFKHNQQMVAEVEKLAAKSRRRDFVVDADRLRQFYAARIPLEVNDVASLNRWLRDTKQDNPRQLFVTREDLLPAAEELSAEAFPDRLDTGTSELPVEYRFEPGAEDDGISLTVPREAVGQLRDAQLGWLVPGLLEAKVEALIRALPKGLRRHFAPAPESAREIASRLPFGQGAFLPAVAEAFSRHAGERITPELLNENKLPYHLQINLKVIDDQGELLAEGRDLEQIRKGLGIAGSQPSGPLSDPQFDRTGITNWDFDDLPASISLRRGHVTLPAFPAIVDEGESVALQLFDSEPRATWETSQGLRRLFAICERRELKSQVEWLPDMNQIRLWAATLMSPAELQQELAALISARAFLQYTPWPRTKSEFKARLKQGKAEIGPAVQDVTRKVLPLFSAYHEVRRGLDELGSRWADAAADMEQQLALLTEQGFLNRTPWDWLVHFPRYLAGISRRLERLTSKSARDTQLQHDLTPHWERFLDHRDNHPVWQTNETLVEYRWMLEEYRVSLFAQQLGTAVKVSPGRLAKHWDRCSEFSKS